MPEHIALNQKLAVIEIESTGTVTLSEANRTIKELKRLMLATGVRRVLADTRGQTVVPSQAGLAQFAERLPRGVVFAVLVSSDQPTRNSVAFVERTGRERGAWIEVFESEETARRWLFEALPLDPLFAPGNP